MDPNETLRRIRAICKMPYNHKDDSTLDELIELTQALDQWLSNGGFKPDEWSTPCAYCDHSDLDKEPID